jgi:hypothetical protein
MLSKLLSLLSTAKGAAAATVIAAAAAGTGVVATNSDVQNAISSTFQGTSTSAKPSEPAHSGQPQVVSVRNDSDKALREAFQDDQKKLEKLRSTKVEPADRGKLEDLIKTADEKLRARLTKALDEIGALTLGREGRESGSPRPSATATPSASPAATVAPGAQASLSADTLAKIDAIVKAAIADMNGIVADTEKAVVALPTARPGGQQSAKPSEPGKGHETGKPSGPGRQNASASPSPTPTH